MLRLQPVALASLVSLKMDGRDHNLIHFLGRGTLLFGLLLLDLLFLR